MLKLMLTAINAYLSDFVTGAVADKHGPNGSLHMLRGVHFYASWFRVGIKEHICNYFLGFV